MDNKEQGQEQNCVFEQIGPEGLEAVLALENLIFTTPWSKEQYSSLMEAGVCKIFGATLEGNLVGYASVSLNRAAGELEIYNLAVHPAMRRRGLARRLTGLVLEAAGTLGLERAILEVREDNAPARGLYEGMGFVECGRRSAYYSNPAEDAVLYEYRFL